MQNESNKVEHLDNEQSNKSASKKLRCKFKCFLKCSQENVGQNSVSYIRSFKAVGMTTNAKYTAKRLGPVAISCQFYRLVGTCHLQTCYNLLKQLAASL